MKLNQLLEQENTLIDKMTQALKELEVEFVKLRFRFNTPQGEFKNQIKNIPGVGMLTTHAGRDDIFLKTIEENISALKKAIERSKGADENTIRKRAGAIRQKYFVLIHKHKMPRSTRGQTVWRKKFNEHSGKLQAGKFLMDILGKYISFADVK